MNNEATIEIPPVDLAGLKVSAATWDKLKYFQERNETFDALSEIVDTAVSEWIDLQGAALIHKEDEEEFDVELAAKYATRSV